MASTWSALQIELLETGANSGTWGTATNVNLGDAVLGEAITGSATVDFAADADVTITLSNSATTQAARNLRLNITESGAGVGCVRNLILGSNCQIEKFYLINNTGTGAKTVKNTSGTGISVPAGKATLVYNNGTNVVDAASYFTSLTLGSALPVASGGTGLTSGTSGGVLAYTASGTLASSSALAASALVIGGGAGAAPSTTTTGTGVVAALGVNTGSAGAFVVNGGALGTPSGGTLTNVSGLPLTSGVTGILPVANGGTGLTSFTSGGAVYATSTSALTTGTLPIASGGTGQTTASAAFNALSPITTAGDLILGNGTNSATRLPIGANGYLLTSNGTTASWQAAPAGGVTTFSAGTTGLTPSSATSGAVTLAGTLAIANGGTNSTATPTAGTIPYGTGTALAYSAAGTSGQVLQSNGASAPTWATPSASAITYLSTTSTAGAASLSISLSAYTATYNAFKIVCTNFYGQTTTADFEVRINNTTSGYISGGGGGRDVQGSGSFGWGARNTSYMMSSYSSTDTLASPSVTVFDLNFFNMNSSSEKFAIGTMVQALKTGSVGGNGIGGVLGGMWINGATPTSINIASTGSFVATVLLYGIKTS